MQLAPHGDVYKPLLLDLTSGIDLIFRHGEKEIYLAVAHQGDGYLARKCQKYQDGVVTLTAACEGDGLHRVSSTDIFSICLQ